MASKLTLLSAFIVVAVAGVSSQQPTTQLFSTRTFYDAIRGKGVQTQAGCTPVALWTLIKPGATYPSLRSLERFAELDGLRNAILENHNKWHSGDLSEEVLKSLEQWTLNVDPSKADRLIESGQRDLTSFLQRLQTQFPRLLHSSRAKFHSIQHNNAPNAVETHRIITSTLLNITTNTSGIGNIDESLGNSSCTRWTQVLRNAEAKAQEFRNSNVMRGIVLDVSRRLGFNKLNLDLIKTAYELCTYDRAISPNQSSAWCSIFTDSELEAFEYEEDILSYYSAGHGNPNHALVSCDFIRVFLQNFSVHKYNADVYFQVANGVLIRAALAAFGIGANEPPINSENFGRAQSRIWRNSFLTPFNGNLVAVLNECGSGRKQMHTVSIFLNEKTITFPTCIDNMFCELSSFERQFQSITRPSFCSNNFC